MIAGSTTSDPGALVAAFEALEIPEGQFRHEDHVKVAWWYLQRFSVPEALDRMSRNLRRFATAHGAPDKYHETITWGFAFVIHERMAEGDVGEDWEAFAARNRDLLRARPSLLESYYSSDRLRSAVARRTFVLPDRVAAAPGRER